ncbi:MAG: HEAT repeat domain-containing protein [Methanomicrobiales archaeon]|nr:HEAT repeat domain-containing protein [Methanomicrobiales archaeon]
MKYVTFRHMEFRKSRNIILGIIVAVCTALELVIHYSLGISTGYTHFYYIFLVPVAILFYWRTVFFGLYLAMLHIGIEYLITGGAIASDTLLRGAMFVVVAFLSGWIFERFESERGDLIEYLLDRSLKGEKPVGADEHETEEGKTAAGRKVEKYRREGNIGALIAGLTHRDIEIRYRSAIALGELKAQEAVGALSAALRDENSGVRWEAAEALGKIGKAAIPALVEAMDDPDDDLRWRAALALGEIGDPAVIAPLILALGDADEYVRSRAAISIAGLGDAGIEPLLMVIHSGGQTAREAAIQALARIAEETGTDPERYMADLDEKIQGELLQAIESAKKPRHNT